MRKSWGRDGYWPADVIADMIKLFDPEVQWPNPANKKTERVRWIVKLPDNMQLVLTAYYEGEATVDLMEATDGPESQAQLRKGRRNRSQSRRNASRARPVRKVQRKD
jgi:hypothetical protein